MTPSGVDFSLLSFLQWTMKTELISKVHICLSTVPLPSHPMCWLQVKGVMPAVTAEQQAELVGTAAPFQNAYLAASLTRMSDAVTAAFPGTSRTLTSSAELQKCIA